MLNSKLNPFKPNDYQIDLSNAVIKSKGDRLYFSLVTRSSIKAAHNQVKSISVNADSKYNYASGVLHVLSESNSISGEVWYSSCMLML